MHTGMALTLFCFYFSALLNGADAPMSINSLAQARAIYNEHYKNSPPGVHVHGKILFVIVELAREELPERAREGRAIEDFDAMLREHVAKKHPPEDNPIPPQWIQAFPTLLPLLQMVDPKMGVFNWQKTFQYKNLPASILHNGFLEDTDIYRYVVAVHQRELENAITRIQSDVPDNAAVEHAFQELWASFAQDGRLAAITDALSLPEDRLRLVNSTLRHRINADALCWGVLFSPRELLAAERRLIAQASRPSLVTLKDIWGYMPVSAQGLADWADSEEAPPWSALNARLLTLDDEIVRVATLEKLSTLDESPAGKYAAWLSELAKQPQSELLRDVKPGQVAWAAWQTLGHANFPDTLPDADTPEYRNAKQLYEDAGMEELPRIAELLLLSVEASPRHAPSWTLLGNVLRHTDAPEDSIWALVQALRLDPDNPTTRANLALAYQAAGRAEWAVGMAASVFAFPEVSDPKQSEWNRQRAMEILEKAITP